MIQFTTGDQLKDEITKEDSITGNTINLEVFNAFAASSRFSSIVSNKRVSPSSRLIENDEDLFSTYTDYEKAVFRNEKFIANQRFECQVIGVDKESLTFKAIDYGKKEADFKADLDLVEVPEEDREFVRVGAVFYLSVGYYTSASTRTKSIDIRFRRISKWPEAFQNKSLLEADQLLNELGWENPSAPIK